MMSTIRDEIRAILREELAALREDSCAPVVESIPITSDADLTRFARDITARAADPEFIARVQNGALRFELAQSVCSPSSAHPVMTNPVSNSVPSGFSRPAYNTPQAAKPPMIHKPIVTERDMAALAKGQRHLRISRNSRLTPLARDEARRLGIRVERCEP